MPPQVKKAHKKRWYQSPRLEYDLTRGKKPRRLTIDVIGSSGPLKGVPLSGPVLALLKVSQEAGKERVLEFGGGVWLRYADYILRRHREFELFVVEFEQAFQDCDEEVKLLRERIGRHATIWTPQQFNSRKNRKQRFDLILLTNVLNTSPEPDFREAIFKAAKRHLYTGGWLAVYQRIWAKYELPSGSESFEHQDGWIIPHKNHDYCTYRARTGAKWFNRLARSLSLRPLPPSSLGISVSSGNTIFKVWQKRL